jgi:hypothetical protein
MIDSALPHWANSKSKLPTDARRDAESLLQHYSFDLGNRPLQIVLAEWQSHFSYVWIRIAVIEALYLGRYKAISVEQILRQWDRRQRPVTHFGYEFEHLVCDRVPRDLSHVETDGPFTPRTIGWFPEHIPGWITLAKRIQAERLQIEAEISSERAVEGSIASGLAQRDA